MKSSTNAYSIKVADIYAMLSPLDEILTTGRDPENLADSKLWRPTTGVETQESSERGVIISLLLLTGGVVVGSRRGRSSHPGLA
jgi:hypothetical protein